eukprot:CAMPEP_0169065498 /NCGR_PEP_ID=MMETSP1015-20121227/2437_1 /TAXON_ID=342587 /ORGANISM="Karlodinium micrum, Strain CCMP2283" /LENGTH=46 /DNA_ID= /DNA_START= /DNA_END= /DNA_ORIENTATION=
MRHDKIGKRASNKEELVTDLICSVSEKALASTKGEYNLSNVLDDDP